jgi:ribosome biogenesis GTPase
LDTPLAKRDKLTEKQIRQVAKNRKQVKQLSKTANLGELKNGLIIGRFGNQADVLEIANEKIFRCFLRQHLGAPVPGDRVSFRLEIPQEQNSESPKSTNFTSKEKGVIESIEERETLLERPSRHKGVKPIVANVNMIFVVVAPLPDFSSILLDRYLVATKNANIETVIVINKCDLKDEIFQQLIEEKLKVYSKIGYPIIKVSAVLNLGKNELLDYAKDKSSILVGQSGVGKSSIINWLFPNEQLAVKEISSNSRLGQHTTTASRIYQFKENSKSYLIDSPGIREYGLWHLSNEQVASGYIEFEKYIGSCKFRDCQHTNEPGCEIILAVKEKKIEDARWKNYVKIINNNEMP